MKRLIYLLLAALGFSCADSHDEWRDVVAEYGCPHVELEFERVLWMRRTTPLRVLR